MSVMSAARDLLTTSWDALDRKPGRSIVQPGATVAWDDCCDGQLWVRVISATPVYQGNSNCAVGMDVTYAVGIVRCVTALDDRGRAPKDTKVTKDGMRTIEDMCTLHTALDGLTLGHRMQIGTWTPLGPNGGCAGGEWAVNIRL